MMPATTTATPPAARAYGMTATPPAFTLRHLTRVDIDAIAAVHARAFPDSLITRLGRDIVRRYYAWYMTDANAYYAAGAYRGQQLVGFAVAGEFRRGLTGFYRANRHAIARAILLRPWLLTDSIFWRRQRAMRDQLTRPATGGKRGYVVLAIGTSPDYQRRGVGQAVLRCVEERARAAGYDRIRLTVRATNTSAIAFYSRAGWSVTRELGGGSRRMEKRWLSSTDRG